MCLGPHVKQIKVFANERAANCRRQDRFWKTRWIKAHCFGSIQEGIGSDNLQHKN